MKISKLKHPTQPLLFEQPIGNHGHVRTVLGDFVEELSAQFVWGRRHKTDCQSDYCPDVSATYNGELAYFECKALGKTNHTFVYQGRLERDRAFNLHHKLYYLLWHHHTDISLATTDRDLRYLFLQSLLGIYLFDFLRFYSACIQMPVTKLNSGYGHSDSNPVYGAGYRIPLSKLVLVPHHYFPVESIFSDQLFDR